MFKRDLFLVVVTCTIIATAQAMDNASTLPLTVKLPSAEKIGAYLYNGGFEVFVNMTHLDQFLGNKEVRPVWLLNKIGAYVDYYPQYLRDEAKRQRQGVGIQVIEDFAPLVKEQVLKCILSESPEVYEALLALEKRVKDNQQQAKL